ncbi:MAG: class I SAM-dependent methyltransferase [Candidatus Saccharicenans sp.]
MKAWQEVQARTGRRSLSPFESVRAAQRYWQQVNSFQQGRLDFLVSRLQPVAGKRILDIGSGPGVLAIPLAEHGATVTAVDPSPAMLELLRQKAEERGLSQIECLSGRWEELNLARDLGRHWPYEAVVASLSLLMVGIRDCLLKMIQACARGGRIYLLWARSQNYWSQQLSEIYPHLYGLEYLPKPGAELLLEVVLELRQELAEGRSSGKCTSGSGNLSEKAWVREKRETDDKNITALAETGEAIGRMAKVAIITRREAEESAMVMGPRLQATRPIPAEKTSFVKRNSVASRAEGLGVGCRENDTADNTRHPGPNYPRVSWPEIAEIAVKEVDFIYGEGFASPVEALEHFQDYFGVKGTDRARVAVIQEFVRKNLKPDNGSWRLQHPLPCLLITIKIGHSD